MHNVHETRYIIYSMYHICFTIQKKYYLCYTGQNMQSRIYISIYDI